MTLLQPRIRIVKLGVTLLTVELLRGAMRLLRLHRMHLRLLTWACEAIPELRASFFAERGLVHASLGQREAAISDVNEAITLKDGSPDYMLYLAWVYEE